MKPYIPLALRGAQILFALLTFILGCVSVADLSILQAYPSLAIVAGIFGLAFYIPTVIPQTVVYFLPAIVLGLEFWTWLWFLIAFAANASQFGSVNCSFLDFYHLNDFATGCRAGKGIIAMAVLAWVLSIVTMVLVGMYAFAPAHCDGGMRGVTGSNTFTLGAIFPRRTAAGAADAEAGVVPTDSADPSKAEEVGAEGEKGVPVDQVPVEPVAEHERV